VVVVSDLNTHFGGSTDLAKKGMDQHKQNNVNDKKIIESLITFQFFANPWLIIRDRKYSAVQLSINT